MKTLIRKSDIPVNEGHIANLLSDFGVMLTTHRVAIAQQIYCCDPKDPHTDADKLYNALQKSEHKKISRATVFNTLNILVNAGALVKFHADDGAAVFDPITEPHCHLYDKKNKKIYDIDHNVVHVRMDLIPDWFHVEHIDVIFKN